MKIIQAHNCPKQILVDEKDFDFLNQYIWHIGKNGYAMTFNRTSIESKPRFNVPQRNVYMHRIIYDMYERKDRYVDHIDGNKINNQRCNLRYATNQTNQFNRNKLNVNNSSGFSGVSFCKKTGKWIAQMMFNKKNIRIGRFETPEEANEEREKFYKKRQKELLKKLNL